MYITVYTYNVCTHVVYIFVLLYVMYAYMCLYVCMYVYVHICMLKYCIACSSSSRFAASATRLNWYSSSWAIRKSFPSIKGMIGKDADYIEIKFSLVNLASVQYISQHTFIYIHTYIRAYKF